MLITNPRPTESAAAKYYESTQYISHQSTPTGLMDYIYLIVRWFTLRWKLSIIKPYLINSKLLDVGCGTGTFLRYCQQSGVETFGVEPSRAARAQAKTNGIPVTDSINSMPPDKYDVITLWHVLEHIYDLHTTLTTLRDHLTDGGTIFIAIPNWQSYDAKYYKEQWAGYDVPRHVWHFGKESMTTLLEKSGYKLRGIIPMNLDAYYVCLLSEKYKTGGALSILGAARGIKKAYQSNGHAKLDMNYSSMIYIAQK